MLPTSAKSWLRLAGCELVCEETGPTWSNSKAKFEASPGKLTECVVPGISSATQGARSHSKLPFLTPSL